MNKFSLKYFKTLYQGILQSIAFYPVLIGFIFFIIAILSLSIENIPLVEKFKEKFSFLFIQDAETSRTILSTLITGILSLTVFSFSMVMVVLNQASANFSPRLLPGLISSKKHQSILGVYIGTLLYCIIIMIALGAYGINENNLGFTTMLSALFGVTCIGFFVYFIHSISGAIQIHNIINSIHESSMTTLDELTAICNKDASHANFTNDQPLEVNINSNASGFYKGFDKDLLSDSLKKIDLIIEIFPFKDDHVWEGQPIARINKQLDSAQIEEILFCLSVSKSRFSGDSIYSNLSKLMEVAVKALSPGVNDPGTAMDVIHALAPLIQKTLKLPKTYATIIEEHDTTLIENNIQVTSIMRTIIQPIREYARADSNVMSCLIKALQFLQHQEDISTIHSQAIAREIDACKQDLNSSIVNDSDRKYLLGLIDEKPVG